MRPASAASRLLPAIAALALLISAAWLAGSAEEFAPVPKLSGPVVDLADVMPPRQEALVTALAHELKQKTGAEIAVLTVRSTAPEDEFSFGMRVVESWQLGEAGEDKGLLMLVAVDDRRMHFLTGYGLEGILPDGKLGDIRDAYVIPAFKQGAYGDGISVAIAAIAQVIAQDAGVTLSGAPAPPQRPMGRGQRIDPRLFMLLFFVLPGLALGRRRRGYGYAPIFFGGGLGRGLGGGGFGGGFGGGGGGGFGGGGAGGGW
jgi:uncharacterized protein